MSDLRRWGRVDSGPFQFGEPIGPGSPALRALTDAELVERARALRSTLSDALAAGTVPVEDRHRARALVERVAGI